MECIFILCTLCRLDKFNPLEYKDFKSENVMDKWIMSKLKYIS